MGAEHIRVPKAICKQSMISYQNTQNRIRNIVEAYKIGFPVEYKQVCESVINIRQTLKDDMATVKVELSGVAPQRALFEMPETLFMSLVKTLDDDELTYFKSKEGARWFIKAFPEFSLTK